jgi:serine/threonine protein kinase
MPGSAGIQSLPSKLLASDCRFSGRKDSKRHKYQLGKELAPNVFLGKNELEETVVIKKLPKRAGASTLPKEVLAGLMLNHANVVKTLDFYQDENNTWVVLEFIEGKDLFTFMNERSFAALDEKMVRHIMNQLLAAIAYCHSVGVVHLDIKLENIILKPDFTVKLIDFGLCDIVDSPSDIIQCWVGSLDYACPEIYLRKPYPALKADVFSLGVVFYILHCGELPFAREERTEVLKLFTKHPSIVWPPKSTASIEAKDLLLHMLEFKTDSRISFDGIRKHNWFRRCP